MGASGGSTLFNRLGRRSARRLAIVLCLAIAAPAIVVAPVTAAPPTSAACANRNNNTDAKLLECVTLEGVRAHQAAFQEIADDNGGNRFSGLPGHAASADYVAARMAAAGYIVTRQEFTYLASLKVGPSALEQIAPGAVTYEEDVDFTDIAESDPGDVTAPVTAVNLQLGLNNSSASGCLATDFTGFPSGNIALIQRGSCSFEIKAENAAAAGAAGVIIFNQGNTAGEDRQGLANVTLGATNTSGIPVLFATYARGAEWAGIVGLEMRIFANVLREELTTENVIAESRAGNPDNVIMVGAHLDSVFEGPGINDNGSGSAAILETAIQMQKVKPRNKVRFAWWGAEESGLVGSDHYVFGLSQAERDKITLYLNFDMVGSPNHVFFIYDGDGSSFGLSGPDGSAAIEKRFETFYTSRGLPFAATAFDGRSDYLAFIENDIPAGGLFTGAEGIKTAEQAALWGGTAGVAYDPCYHQACDTYANVNEAALATNADAIAHMTLQYAQNTSEINGVKGKGNFKPLPPLAPAA
jgi:aminopeptidase Y